MSSLAFAGPGPKDTLYVTADGGAWLVAIHGTGEGFYSTVEGSEGPIAVYNEIKTTGMQESAYGASYTLSGQFSGNFYTSQVASTVIDGTTDGTHNYVIDSAGNVYSTNTSYQIPVQLFSAESDATGIAYDPVNESLWVDNGGVLTDYAMGGSVLGGFATGLNGGTALAFDRTDGTLWAGENLGSSALLSQYSVGGSLLQSYFPSSGFTIEGMEFNEAVPEPEACTVCGVGVALLISRKKGAPRRRGGSR